MTAGPYLDPAVKKTMVTAYYLDFVIIKDHVYCFANQFPLLLRPHLSTLFNLTINWGDFEQFGVTLRLCHIVKIA